MTESLILPRVTGLADARTAVGEAARQATWSLSDDKAVARVADAVRLRAQADSVLLAAIGEIDARGLARARGATSTTAWLQGAHQVGPGEAAKLVGTARALREHLSSTAEAMSCGKVQLGQAQVIVHALADLPKGFPTPMREVAEATMIGHCTTFGPVPLSFIGRRLEECLDPDGVQARDEKKLLEREKRAFDKRAFNLSDDPYGPGGSIRGLSEAEGAAIIRAALDPLSAPRPVGIGAEKDSRSAEQRRYDALVELCRRYLAHPASTSGDSGKTQLRITIPLESLTERLGAGTLDSGQLLSPSAVRRLACDAQLIPIVLGGASQILDVGAARRLYTGPQRIAIETRDGGCTWPGCSRPVAWCEIHHILPRLDGGLTNRDNAALLCTAHHREIEKGDWELFIRGDRAWYRPPAWIDAARTPILNATHRPPPN